MSNEEIAYYLNLSSEQVNGMLCQCSGIDEALVLLEKIGHARAWYIYQKGGELNGSPNLGVRQGY